MTILIQIVEDSDWVCDKMVKTVIRTVVEIVMILIQLYSLVHWTFGMMGLTRTVTVPEIMTKMAMDTILLPPAVGL